MMVKAATDKSKSGIVCTVAVWVNKMVQSPSENDNSQYQCKVFWSPQLFDPETMYAF